MFFFCSGSFQMLFGQSVTISGVVKEKDTDEGIPYVTFIDSLSQKGLSSSNAYGFFSFSVEPGRKTTFIVRHIGYKTAVFNLFPSYDSALVIKLEPSIHHLDEIVIGPEPEVAEPRNSHIVSTAVIKQAPALLGEKDALKVLQLLPGIQRGVEGSAAFYVRGGGADQNLIIADDATIYNANHLFCFLMI